MRKHLSGPYQRVSAFFWSALVAVACGNGDPTSLDEPAVDSCDEPGAECHADGDGLAETDESTPTDSPPSDLPRTAASGASRIGEDSDILLDTNQNNFRAVTSVSCSNCHAGGLIPAR